MTMPTGAIVTAAQHPPSQEVADTLTNQLQQSIDSLAETASTLRRMKGMDSSVEQPRSADAPGMRESVLTVRELANEIRGLSQAIHEEVGSL